jgi:hypothetical protein
MSRAKRNRLAALDVDGRRLLSWNPNAKGVVRALALNDSKLALVDLASGRVDSRFRPAVKGRVRSIALAGDRLYVGGDFTRDGPAAGAKVAALDPINPRQGERVLLARSPCPPRARLSLPVGAGPADQAGEG